jgi:hypothetical protein
MRVLFVVLVLSMSSGPAVAQSVAVESKVNLRVGPAKSTSSLGTLSSKDTVEAVAADTIQNGFIHVRTQAGRNGWVAIPFAHRIRLAISADSMGAAITALGVQPLVAIGCTTCGGTERWDVKTLSDNDAGEVVFTPVNETIKNLRTWDAPAHRPESNRLGEVERTTYVVKGDLLGWTREGDQDLHLVIADANNHALTMVAEIPQQSCRKVCSTKALRGARANESKMLGYFGVAPSSYKALKTPVSVTITGVGFFDKPHKACGRSLHNTIEIHPVLKIEFDDSQPPSGQIYTPTHPACK